MIKITSKYTLIASACAALFLAGCGGGGGTSTTAASTSTDTGASTIAGTVTGFGSVVVDGVRIDDHAVVAGMELEDGTVVPRELKIGQHVEVQHDGNLVATQVRIGTEVEGPVDTIDASAGTLVVLGQTVRINTDAALGPVTVFDAPYTALTDISVGDNVEIHGLLKTDAAGKPIIQATRIEKKALDAYNRVTGIVSDLSASASTFKLGDLVIGYSAAKLLPAGATLANGEEVHVSIPAGPSGASASPVQAKVVKVREHKTESHGQEAELGGAISALDATAKTFMINGTLVDASTAAFIQPGKTFSDLKANSYVVVKGTYASDQSLKATRIVIRGIDDEKGSETEIHGSILDFTSTADFTLRGIHVDASTARIDLSACPDVAQLANAVQVEVEGSLSPTGAVKASTVTCEPAHEGQSILARLGTVSAVDITARSFALATEKGVLTVQWNPTTLFVRADASTLDGKRIIVEGVLSGTTFTATKIVLASK